MKTKQATAAGHAVAKGVATGMQAATAEIGASLAQTVSSAAGGGKGSDGIEKTPTAAAVAAASVGGVGMELLRVSLLELAGLKLREHSFVWDS